MPRLLAGKMEKVLAIKASTLLLSGHLRGKSEPSRSNMFKHVFFRIFLIDFLSFNFEFQRNLLVIFFFYAFSWD